MVLVGFTMRTSRHTREGLGGVNAYTLTGFRVVVYSKKVGRLSVA
jgi:hypothetical protein